MSDHRLLSLGEAAERLGVHRATLRRWADAGTIPVHMTAGGHRRFRESDVTGFSKTPSLPTRTAHPHMAEKAIAHTREGIRGHHASWMSQLDDDEREEHRLLGRRLVGLLMQYISTDDGEGEALLQEARVLGRIYAKGALRAGIELTEALEATLFFRDNLVETALLLPESVRQNPENNARLYRRINGFLNAVQIAVASTYDKASSE